MTDLYKLDLIRGATKRLARLARVGARPVRRAVKLAILLGPLQAVAFAARWLARRRIIEVELRGIPTRLKVRHSDSDMFVLWTVFGQRVVDVELPRPPELVVDAGAYVGYSSVYYAAKYPNARIVAIEPAPENFRLLLANCRDFPNIHPIRAAIWSSAAELHVHNRRAGSPGALSWTFAVSEAPLAGRGSVRGITIPQILERFGAERIDLLKMDIEGGEEVVFAPGSGYGEWLDLVDTLAVEFHGPACRDAVLAATAGHGFVRSRHGELFVFRKGNAAQP